MKFKVKRAMLALLCILVCVELSAPWATPQRMTTVYTRYPRTYEDFYTEAAARLTKLDDVTMYVLTVCKQEKVDPIEMLAILQVENPKHDKKALNINYVQTWNKKLKRYVKKEVSRDVGVFQLNSSCFETFVWFFWEEAGETEEFDATNYKHNIRVAVRLHKSNKKQFNGSLYYAVLAYNSGSGKVSSGRVAKRTVEEYWPLFQKYYIRMKGV